MASYITGRDKSTVYHRIGSKEHEPGLCATVCKNVVNNKILNPNYVSKLSFLDKLYDPEYTGSKDIVFLQMSLPGRHFEPFDQEACGIIMTLHAYMQLMKFFRASYHDADENLDLLKTKFVREPSQETLVVLSPEVSFVGEGSSTVSYLVDSQKNYDLVLDCVWWSEGDLKYSCLYYNFHHPTIHSEAPFYIPVDVFRALVNRSMDQLVGALRHSMPPPPYKFLIKYCSKEQTQPAVSSPVTAIQQSLKSSSSSPRPVKSSSSSSSSRSRHESPPRKKSR